MGLGVKISVFVCFCLTSAATLTNAQTQCSVKVPVPDLTYCDATGSLEAHVDADVHVTQGHVQAVQEYQSDTFRLFAQQLTETIKDNNNTEKNINNVEAEIASLKGFLESLLTPVISPEANDVLPEINENSEAGKEVHREKRAVPNQNPSQQSLNAAKLAFQQQLASINQKLQSIASSIANDLSNSAALHIKLQTELATNQQYMNATENDIKSIETKIMNALKARNTGSGGTSSSLSAVTQDVMDLIINSTVSEQVNQRRLDDIDTQTNLMEATVRQTASRLATFAQDITDLDLGITNTSQQASNIKSAERIYEDQVGMFLSNATRDVASLTANLGPVQTVIADVGRQVFNATMTIGAFEIDLKAYRREMDSAQSVVTFSKNLRQTQSGTVLQLKRTLTDNIELMKYAFGLRNTPP